MPTLPPASPLVATHVGPLREWAHLTDLWVERASTAPSPEQLALAGVGQSPKPGQQWPMEGDWVGVRLNLNLLRSTGLPVQTLHRGAPPKHTTSSSVSSAGFRGRALGYCGAVEVANAHFVVNQVLRERIAQGQTSKIPMASVDGQLRSRAPDNFDGIEVAFNPAKSHLFVDAKGRAVKFAELAVVCGHRVYVRGQVEWHDEASAPARVGQAPSLASVRMGTDSATAHSIPPESVDSAATPAPAFGAHAVAASRRAPRSRT